MKKNHFTLTRWAIALAILFGSLAGSPARGALNTSSVQPLSSGGVEGVSLLSSSASGLSFTLEMPLENLSRGTFKAQGQVFEALEVGGWERLNEPGLPALPYQTVTFGVPFGAEVSLQVTPGPSSSLALNAPLMPGITQLPIEDSINALAGQSQPAAQTELILDSAAYARASAYPGELARLTNDGILRGQRLVSVAVFPLQYNAALNSLRVYENLTVKVAFMGGQVSNLNNWVADSEVFEQQLQNLLLNYLEARAWRQPASGSSTLTANELNWDVPNPAWKVTLTTQGFYLLSRDALSAAGFPVDTPTPANIQLFNQGQPVAIEVRLDAQNHVASIIFFGEALESKYSNKNVYWLTVGTNPGLRMSTRSVTPGTATLRTSHTRLEHFDSVPGLAQYYLAGATGTDDFERYFMGFIAPTSDQPIRRNITLPFNLDHAPIDGSGTLRASLYSMMDFPLNPDHHVAFYVNDIYVGDTWFDGRNWHNVSKTIPVGLLRSGANTIKVTCPNDTGLGIDSAFVDWLELEFADPFIANGEKLTFSTDTSGTWRYQVSGFSASSAVEVFEISDPRLPARLTGATFASGTLNFQDTVVDTKTYLALGTGQYLSPLSILQDVPSDIKSATNSADLVILSPASFTSAITPLATYRAGQGTRTVVVDPQEVYDAFGYGIVSPYAIRAFLAYTQANWVAPAPSYALLVGDGHRDPKNYEGFGRENFMTPFLVWADANLGETSSDNRYVSFDGEGDLLADMIIGRLPVNTAADVTAMVNKILAYEALEPNSAAWQKQVLFVADDLPYFANLSDFLSNYYVVPSEFSPVKVYQGVAPYETLALARAGVQAGINTGKLFVNYIGHGTTSQWADSKPNLGEPKGGLFYYADIPLLTNNGKPPIVLGMTCWEGYYINPNPLTASPTSEALAELFTRKPLGGALASWSASGTAVSTGHFSLNAGFFEAYFNDGVGTLGEATQAGKLALWATGYALDLLETYHLFGDPTTLFKRGLTAVSDDYEVNESAVLTVPAPGVLANDINPDGLSLSAQYVEASGPAHGILDFNQDGSFTYTPTPGWKGLDRFYYRVVSGVIQTVPTFVNLFVRSTNSVPATVPDTFTGFEDTQLVVPAPGVLANDTDVDGDTITAELYQTTTRGYLSLQADGSFTYSPYSNINGDNIDSFSYRAYDGEDYSAVTTVTINLTPVNDAPIGVPDSYSTTLNTPLVVPAPGVLIFDFDPEGDPLTAVLVPDSGSLHGLLSLNANGSFTYTPNTGYTGMDAFSYKAFDGFLYSNPVLVDLYVNIAPYAANDAYILLEDTPLTINAPGVLGNDDDPNGAGLSAESVTDPSHGLLTFYSDGSFTYAPTANFHGQDSFTYKAFDGHLYTGIATVTLTIDPVNDAPVAIADAYVTSQNSPLVTTALTGVLVNDTDIDGDPLTAVWVSDPGHGTLVLNADGSFTYTPAPNYYGSDTFSYKAFDNTAYSEPVLVSITVQQHASYDLYLPIILR